MRLTAVNHWDVAIATHTANHPSARHWCEDVDTAKPFKIVPERRLDVLWASPSCTEHSYAKGGHSIDDQNRASAWVVPRMAESLRPKVIIVENVRQFIKWGPIEPVYKRDGSPKLDAKGQQVFRPIKKRSGETFRAWFAAIEALGYTGRWDLLNAADFGEPQTRVRLFIVFAAPGIEWTWPGPTHGPADSLEVASGLRKPWVPAREIVELGVSTKSIFEPVFGRTEDAYLSPNTIRRIVAGVQRYCSPAFSEAFLVILRHYAGALSLDEPLPTIATGSGRGGGHIALAEPTLVPVVIGQHGGGVARSVDDPLPTVTTDGVIRVAEPVLVDVRHGDRPHQPRSLDDPLTTVTAKNGVGLAEPFVVSYYGDSETGGSHAPRSIDDPIPTVTTANRFGVAEPFIVPQNGDGTAALDDPLPTVTTTSRGVRLVEPYLVAHFGEREGQAPRTHGIDEPLPTVTHRGAGDLVEPVIEPVAGEAPSGRVVMIDGKPYLLDVRFRMLQPHELARAQGFPDDYQFTGSKSDRTAQIGNAVPVGVAHALGRAALRALGYGDRDEEAA